MILFEVYKREETKQCGNVLKTEKNVFSSKTLVIQTACIKHKAPEGRIYTSYTLKKQMDKKHGYFNHKQNEEEIETRASLNIINFCWYRLKCP